MNKYQQTPSLIRGCFLSHITRVHNTDYSIKSLSEITIPVISAFIDHFKYKSQINGCLKITSIHEVCEYKRVEVNVC